MSCENENVEYWRLVQKYSTISGVAPTIPPSQDHSDGTWSDTDLYIGEFFMNVSDNLLWYRTIDGIHLVTGATGASGSFVGDYVPTSGGTYSGGVFAPTFSSNTITSALITASAFNGQIFGSSGSVFYGDGSNLTGIVVGWNGGTVSNPVGFVNNVSFENPIVINGPISTVNSCVDFQSDICVSGGVSASYFVGDGSGLTGIVATYSDTYTTDAYLQGSSIYFDRTNGGTASYFVDLTPILSTYSILTTNWDPSTSEFQITTNGGDTFTETINEFASLNVLSSVTANDFYGTFHGTFSNDIYTTSATLYGTDAVFMRTDGGSYSLDLSTLSGGGSGSVGPTGATGATGADGYRAVMNLSYTGSSLTLGLGTITLPIGVPINNLGWQQGTRVRVFNDATHYMEGQITSVISNPQTTGINVNIDYVVGSGSFGVWYVGIAGDVGSSGVASQSLSQTLAIGNTAGNSNIIFNNSYGLENSTGEADIKMDAFQIDAIHRKYTTATDWKRGLFLGSGHNGVAAITGDDWNVTSDLYRAGSVEATNTYSKMFYQETVLSTNNTYQTSLFTYKDSILVNSSYNTSTANSNFAGIQYNFDHSANFTNRSLVDKEYVDNAVAGGGGGGLTWSGNAGYLSFFDGANSLASNDIYYDGRYTIGHGIGWDYDSYSKFGIYDPYSPGPAITAEGSQFGGTFMARGSNGGQNIGLQAYAQKSTISGNLALYGRADGTQSNNMAAYFVAEGGTLYPGYTGYDNLGVDIYVDSQNSVSPNGVTNSGIRIGVYGRVGDNNYIAQLRDGSEGVGKVLTCITADGIATWQTPTGGGGGGTFSGGTVSNATTFQSDVTFQANVLDENGTSVDFTNILNMTNLALMYNT
jgi:hypothetical protein